MIAPLVAAKGRIMRERAPSSGPKPKPRLTRIFKEFPFWYLFVMILLLLLWQTAGGQYAVRTSPYSEFKEALKNGEVTECLVKDDAVEGKIQPKAPAPPSKDHAANPNPASPPKPYVFRAVRVEDPKLAE